MAYMSDSVDSFRPTLLDGFEFIDTNPASGDSAFSASSINYYLDQIPNQSSGQLATDLGTSYSYYSTAKSFVTYIPEYGPYIRAGAELGEFAYNYLNG